MYRSHGGDSSTGLPEPWQENVSSYLSSLIPPVLLSPSRRGRLVAAFPFVSALGAMERNENPLSGTIYDVPYNKWRGTDEPWNYSRLHPFDLDYDPQIVPDGYSTSVHRGRTVAD